MKIFRVPAGGLNFWWPHVERRMEEALEEHGRHWGYTVKDLKRLLKKDLIALHLAFEDGGMSPLFIGLTETVLLPQKLTYRVMFLTGEKMELWLEEGMEYILANARACGAQDIEINGRKGWERVLAPSGFSVDFICLRKELWPAAAERNRPQITHPGKSKFLS